MDPKEIGKFLLQPSTADVMNTPFQRGGFLPIDWYPGDRGKLNLGSGITGALADMLTAPSRAYKGEMSEDQMVPEAVNMASMLMGGGMAAPRPRNALTAFGSRPPRNGFELDYFGTPVQIVQNPSERQLATLLPKTKYQAARRIVDPDTGDVFIWDAADPALHQMMAEKLGIKFDPSKADIIEFD